LKCEPIATSFKRVSLRERFLVDGLIAGISGTQVTVATAAGPEILKVMAANGSPAPLFESDDDRLSFVIGLPSHPLAMGGITPPNQATGEVTGEVERLLRAMDGEMSRQKIQEVLALKHEDHFRNACLKPALTLGVIAMTLPDKPRSSYPRYRLTARGT
jgi:ATP-dependent DNA helicase RecG